MTPPGILSSAGGAVGGDVRGGAHLPLRDPGKPYIPPWLILINVHKRAKNRRRV